MTIPEILLLAGAGLMGGLSNAIAGGGTFFTFPALVAVGLAPVAALATSVVAIWPGHATSLLGYRDELRREGRRLTHSVVIFALGAVLGASLLLASGDALFRGLVPWLVLAATLLFAAGPTLLTALRRYHKGAAPPAVAGVIEFAVAIYGGYFGAGLGIMLMAVLTLVGVEDLNVANALKNALATVATTVAAVIFMATGTIDWMAGGIVFGGAIVGGWLGARIARWVKPAALRAIVIAAGLTLFWSYL
ncbi:sulfite exporter TauE/SafE family protein [Chelatococcus sp. GCM10030263]|uniref:sulfite exporter TauE/SafE family protein n=1 Tax=Chelatococcus sp. GCM10030263 TaxID=3273387 RepID=UPI00361CA9D4